MCIHGCMWCWWELGDIWNLTISFPKNSIIFKHHLRTTLLEVGNIFKVQVSLDTQRQHLSLPCTINTHVVLMNVYFIKFLEGFYFTNCVKSLSEKSSSNISSGSSNSFCSIFQIPVTESSRLSLSVELSTPSWKSLHIQSNLIVSLLHSFFIPAFYSDLF